MSPQAFFCAVFAVGFLYFAWRAALAWSHRECHGLVPVGVFVLAAVCAYFAYQGTTPEHLAAIAAEDKAQRAAEQREQTPHVIREADGCKVYAFKSGDRYHYFTRCPNSQTTTESSWETCTTSGKTRTCKTNTEVIEARQ